MFNGLGMHPGSLSLLSKARSRSISPENPTGEPGQGGRAVPSPDSCARELGVGWKVRPFVTVGGGETLTMADITGAGAVQQMWMTFGGNDGKYRDYILRIYYEGESVPAVEVPVGDFFCHAWRGDFFQLSSLMVCHNPGSAFCCYWEMPFRKRCRITLENIGPAEVNIFYQINYALSDAVPEECGYFHARFHRENPLPYGEVYPILDVAGHGHYAGTYLAWGVNNSGWWGEGEIKFYIDGDREFPTICGTGTEDYFCGSYNFEDKAARSYREFCTPYSGLPQVVRPDGLYDSQQRFGLYRWHICDPVRFSERLRVTIQALGWRSEGRYLPLQDDIASVAYFYLASPSVTLPPLPTRNELEII